MQLPTNAPRSWPDTYIAAFDHVTAMPGANSEPCRAKPRVTAGLRCAPDLKAMYAAVNTANPQPKVMPIQPALNPLVVRRVLFAHSDVPMVRRTAVPRNSEKKTCHREMVLMLGVRIGERGGRDRAP